MGAFESTDGLSSPPPPPPSQTTLFVMRNGRYEPQYLMPIFPRNEIVDFDGFRRGPGFMSSRPPDMRQTSLVKNPASVRRDSFKTTDVSSDAAEGGLANVVTLSFVFDAARPGKLLVHLMVREEEDESGILRLVPQGRDNEESLPPSPFHSQDFAEGMGLVCTTPPIDLSLWPQNRFAAPSADRPEDVPLAVELRAEPDEQAEKASSQFTYVALAAGGGGGRQNSWQPALFAQKLQHGDQLFVLHELYGIWSKHSGASEDDIEGSSECIICLSEPRDTAVLPCRHMCFCSYCAGIVRLQCEKCPICRQRVVSLLQFKREQEQPTSPPAPLGANSAPTAATTGGSSRPEEVKEVCDSFPTSVSSHEGGGSGARVEVTSSPAASSSEEIAAGSSREPATSSALG